MTIPRNKSYNYIDLSKIQVVPETLIRSRPDINSQQFKEQVDSVKRYGIMLPVILLALATPTEEGYTHKLLDGDRRMHWATAAGMTEIPFVEQDEMDEQNELRSLTANLQRDEMKPGEVSAILKRLIQYHPNWTDEELASAISKSTTYVRQRLNLMNLPEEIKELYEAEKIKVSNAIQLLKLDPNDIAAYVDQAQRMDANAFSGVVAQRLNEVNEAKRKGRAPKAANSEFNPHPKFRTQADLLSRLSGLDNGTIPNSGTYADGIRYALSLDSDTVAQSKVAWEAKQAADKARREKAKAEQTQKRLDSLKKL